MQSAAERGQVLQPPEGPHAGALYPEALLDVLEEHLDAPSAEVGVGREGRRLAQFVRWGVRAGEVQRVEAQRRPVERARHHEDGQMCVSGREEPRAPAHRGLDAPGRGPQRRADAGRARHFLVSVTSALPVRTTAEKIAPAASAATLPKRGKTLSRSALDVRSTAFFAILCATGRLLSVVLHRTL